MLGEQSPRVYAAPKYAKTSGEEAVELAELAGLELDPWQQLVLRDALGERGDGNWAAASIGVVCPRQNGKNAILEARELAGLFLLGERLIVHTAHQYDTSMEAYNRLKFLIENTPAFDKRVKRYVNAHGTEGIEMKNGQRIRFRTRTKGGGRGFSGDCVIFDEAMEFPQASLNAILPIVSARPNPQVWYTGSAVDQVTHVNGEVLTRIRSRGLAGDDPRLAYFEWSVDLDNPEALEEKIALNPKQWAIANPALGRRITTEYVLGEYTELGPRGFAVERLGIGDWPNLDGAAAVIDPSSWAELTDRDSKMNDPVVLSFDVSPDRAFASVGAAGLRSDGLKHVEVAERQRGTGWVVPWLAERNAKWRPLAIVCDGIGPAASLLPELVDLNIEVTTLTAAEHAAACGWLYDAVQGGQIRHLGQPELNAAVRNATKRPMGDRWAWDRRSSGADISPLVACTLALWGVMREPPKPVPRLVDLDALDDD